MKVLPLGWRDAIQAGVTHFAHAWRLTRQDGLVLCATNHDQDLTVGGQLFRASQALLESPADQTMSLSPGHAALSGALDLAGVREADIALGLWDQARVEAYLVDWLNPEHALPLWTGYVQAITQQDAHFEFQIQTLDPALNRTIGRLYSRSCDADLGDARCGVNLALPAYGVDGHVLAVSSDRALRLAISAPVDVLALTGGAVQVTTGPATGLHIGVGVAAQVAGGLDVQLLTPMPLAPDLGDGVHLQIGCDKQFATCRDRFANSLNFRGMPTLPGDEAALAGPSATDNSGGKR